MIWRGSVDHECPHEVDLSLDRIQSNVFELCCQQWYNRTSGNDKDNDLLIFMTLSMRILQESRKSNEWELELDDNYIAWVRCGRYSDIIQLEFLIIKHMLKNWEMSMSQKDTRRKQILMVAKTTFNYDCDYMFWSRGSVRVLKIQYNWDRVRQKFTVHDSSEYS